MNLTILDNRLRTLTSSEKLYLNGKKSLFVEMAHGSSSIPCLSYEHIPGTLSGSADEFQIYLADLNISLKKQSRYCEVPAHMHNYVELCYMYSGQCSQIVKPHTTKVACFLVPCQTSARLPFRGIGQRF